MVLNTYNLSVTQVSSLKLYIEETGALLPTNRMQKNQLKHPFW